MPSNLLKDSRGFKCRYKLQLTPQPLSDCFNNANSQVLRVQLGLAKFEHGLPEFLIHGVVVREPLAQAGVDHSPHFAQVQAVQVGNLGQAKLFPIGRHQVGAFQQSTAQERVGQLVPIYLPGDRAE